MGKGSTHHIAIDSQGYVFADSPDRPKRTMQRNTVFGNRFASGDRDYTDLSFWWYWAQTDWANGVKNELEWEDDAKYYQALNIDAWSKAGEFKIMSGYTTEKDFNDNSLLTSGCYGDVNGETFHFVGTRNITPNVVYQKDGTWSDITTGGGVISNDVSFIWYLMSHNNDLWILTGESTDNSDAVISWTGAAFTDHAAAIKAEMTWGSLHASLCGVQVNDVLYLSIVDKSTTPWTFGIVKTVDGGANWVKVLDRLGERENGQIISMATDETDIYYVVAYEDNFFELWHYDISTSSVAIMIRRIFTSNGSGTSTNTTYGSTSFFGNGYLHYLNGKFIMTVPDREVWEYDPSAGTIERILQRRTDQGNTTYLLPEGGKLADDKIWWGGLMYNGSKFYPTKKNISDGGMVVPLYSDGRIMYWRDYGTIRDQLIYDDNFKSAGIDYNYITLNEMQEISTIEKIANSVTIIFDTFDTAEEIEVKYSIDGGATYTSLGTATEAIDGSSITQKTFLFGDDVTFYKMLIRIHLDGDGTSTPTIKDISMQYLPIPDYKYRWSFILDCGDDITTLDNKSKELLKGVDLRHKLRTSFLKRELLELEDVDYAETKMNDASPAKTDVTITVDSTDDFPEQGRIKINDEEILYTGKTRTTFTGCTRGYRGTNAAAHADNDVISNKYKVLITDYNESIPLSNESRIGEFEVAVEMLEA